MACVKHILILVGLGVLFLPGVVLGQIVMDEGSIFMFSLVVGTEEGVVPTEDPLVVLSLEPANSDLTVDPTRYMADKDGWHECLDPSPGFFLCSNPETITLEAAEDDDAVDDHVTLTALVTGGGANFLPNVLIIDVTIRDNDNAPSLVVTPTSVEVDEGETTTFEVELGARPSSIVVVDIAVDQGTDGERDLDPVAPTTLIFTPFDWSEAETVMLTAIHDTDFVDDEETLTLTARGGSTDVKTVDVTIRDIDTPGLVVTPTSIEVDEGETATFKVELEAQPPSDVEVRIDGYVKTDTLASTPRELTFTPANWDISQTVTIGAIHDADFVDDRETLTLTARGGSTDDKTVNVMIKDDDMPGFVVTPTSIEVDEGETATFKVELEAQPPSDVEVRIDGYVKTDTLASTPRELTFTPANWDIAQTVTIGAIHDADFEDDRETLTLTTSGGFTDDKTVNVTIWDDDTPGLVITPTSVEMEEGETAAFTARLEAQPSANVTVMIAGYENTDLSGTPPSPLSLIFTPPDYHLPQSVTLTASEDDDDILDEEVILHLTALDGGYTGVTADVTVTIRDNDEGMIVAPESVTMNEGGTYPLPVRLSAQPSGPVTVTFSGHAGSDLALNGAPLTFTPSNWDREQTVTLTAAEDEDDYADDTVGLILTASGGDYDGVEAMVTVTIIDNDEEPLTVTIYDEQELENTGAIQLPIELNRPADQVVTVQYGTTDGTAEAGEDYTTSRGIVLFDPGATRGVIEIEVTDDELSEGTEAFVVTLSQPRNATITRETGTGTILDDDGGTAILRVDDALVLEEEGMVRFRVSLSHPQRQLITAAYQTQDGTARAGEDYESSSGVVTLAPGTVEATIAVPLLKDGLDWQEETFTMHLVSSKHAEIAKAVGVATIQESTTVSEAVLEAYSARFVRTSSAQIVEALGERFRSGADGAACGAADRAEMAQLWYSASEWDPSLGELLSGCRMSASSYSGAFSVWGRGAFRQFNGRTDDALTLSGEVTTGMLGADYRWQGGWLAGVLLAHSRGDGSFEVVQQSGEITAGLTGVYPYVSYARAEWDVWLSAGAGRGQAEVLELKGDLMSKFGAMGVRGTLVSSGTIGLNYHGDVLVTDAELKDHEVTAEVYRVRAGVEANAKISDGLRPYVEASVRSDGGSAETGIGLEFGGGIRVDYPAWRLKGDVRTQGLVMHTADGFTEWGLSGSLQVGSRSEGLMVRVRPTWGRGQGMSVYGQQTILDATPIGSNAQRTELELGYGIPWKDGTARSVMGVTQLSQGMMYRLGGELHPRERLTFSVFGLAHGRAATLGDIGLNMRGSLRY